MASMTGEGSIHNQSTMTNQEQRPVLRRATYVHVSDLTNVYNIDHAMLEQELKRVKESREDGVAKSDTKAELSDEEVDPAEIETSPQKRLQPPRAGYNLCVLVGKVTLVVDKKRVDQSRVRLAEVEIGDETGTVSLRARDEQIDLLEHVSSLSGAVVLRNCTLELFQGKHIRLAVTKWGKLSVYPDSVASTPPAPSKINYERNFSEIDLSVVASEMVEEPPENFSRSKTLEQQESGNRPGTSKGGHKQQHSQSSTRRGGRERRQSKGKQGLGSFEHAPVPQPYGQIRYTAIHPYPSYEMDPRQFPYSRQQDTIMANASAQQLMLQRQYELQQHQLRQLYHSQQDHDRVGMPPSRQSQSSGMMMQPVVPVGSFDTSEYHATSYSSTTSSPILIPMAIPGTHGPSGLPLRGQPNDQRRRVDIPGSSATGPESNSPQYMSVSPDDSSQLSARMNPEATAFSPTYIAQGNQASGHQMYLHYDPSNPSQPFPPPQSLHQAMYAGGVMYVPSAAPEHQHGDRTESKQLAPGSSDQPKGKRPASKGKENAGG